MDRYKKDIVVYTSGTFDLFHIGHLNILMKSKELGDRLVVGVSTDELVASYKRHKPIVPYEDRATIVKHIDCVDIVVQQEKLTPVALLQKYDVDIVTIGSDWKDKYLEGLEWMRQQKDKKLVYLPYTQRVSTTNIKKVIINGWQEDKTKYFSR